MHAMRLKQLCMNQFQKSGSSNDGSPIFLRFGYPVTQTYDYNGQTMLSGPMQRSLHYKLGVVMS